jgi:uncharacterized membrane protein YgcG
MNKIRLVIIASLTTLTLALGGVNIAQAGTNDFDIISFDATYNLSRDTDNVATMKVTEKIVANFPDFDQNHGILRAIPETYKNHSLELEIDSITNGQGTKYTYESSSENDNQILKVGDPEKYAHGKTTYIITYSLRGVISNQTNQQELYWDVNGDQWKQPFGSVTAQVIIDDTLAGQVLPQTTCYTGKLGGLAKDCTSAQAAKSTTFATRRTLQPGETLTLAMAFKPGTFADYKPSQAQIAKWVGTGLVIALPAVIALIVAVRGWYKRGRDPQGKGVVVPQYTPPKGVTVLESSAVLKEGFDPKAVSATIVDLAVRHYIKIYEVKEEKIFKNKTNYDVELIKNTTDLPADERQVMAMIFGTTGAVGERVSLKDSQNKLYEAAQRLGKTVDLKVTADGYFRVLPSKAKQPYLIAAGLLGVVGFFFLPLSLGLLVAAGILFLASFTMPARTEKGVELRAYLLGIKDYIQLAEAERLRVLQSPHGELTEKVDVGDKHQLVKLYEHLLPYAMLFGIEKDWAKEFAPLYDQPPDWYAGSAGFNAVYFATAMSSFTTAASSSFTPPSSSSSSGFGGGAGGGGGGGGGGGW